MEFKAMPIMVHIRISVLVMAMTTILDGCRSLKKEAWETAPLGENETQRVRLADQETVTTERVRFFSREMNSPWFFLVLAPKATQPPDTVLILNHGWADRPETMLAALNLEQVYAKLLADGRVQPALIILPDVRFPDEARKNSKENIFAEYLDLVAEEVARTVSQTYGVPFSRDKWGMGGFSFGGYLSLDVGRRFSGRFGSISAVSAPFEDEWSFWPTDPPPPGKLDREGRGLHTVVEPGPIPRLFLACGMNDRYYGTMMALHQKFQSRGINHEWSAGPGGHTWSYWSTVVESIFMFHLGHRTGQN
jgi:enterochelin esterase-like enzyme